MTTTNRVIERHELSDGKIAVIQRIRRRYTTYVIPAEILEAPEYHAESATKKEAYDALESLLANDLCDVM